MRRRLELETWEAAPDGGGGDVGAWRALGWHWAKMRAVSAHERSVGSAALAEISHRIELRWRPHGAISRPVASQRFREGARVFEIVAVAEADDENRALLCWVREGAAG